MTHLMATYDRCYYTLALMVNWNKLLAKVNWTVINTTCSKHMLWQSLEIDQPHNQFNHLKQLFLLWRYSFNCFIIFQVTSYVEGATVGFFQRNYYWQCIFRQYILRSREHKQKVTPPITQITAITKNFHSVKTKHNIV